MIATDETTDQNDTEINSYIDPRTTFNNERSSFLDLPSLGTLKAEYLKANDVN